MGTTTITVLFTDIEGSTRLWERHGDAMARALAEHDQLLRDVVEGHAGALVKETGDGVLAAFNDPVSALAASAAAQRSLARSDWGDFGALHVRMAVHSGRAEHRDGDYHGPALNRAARLMAIGHGGQVLVSDATRSLVEGALPEGFELVDLGEHRLRDLSEPERVHQLLAIGLRSEFPPLRSLEQLPTNLPVELTTFVGRERELRSLTELLRGQRLVTITGVGGVGKTRLALQVAADLLPELPDGAWVCELAAAEDGVALAEVVAVAVGALARRGRSLEVSIVEHVRDKTLLLVVDNCEHLLDPVSSLVERVLRECPGVIVLATSREGMGLDGEQVWPLRSLKAPDAGAPLAEVAATESVRLFVDRAAAVNPEFRLDEGSAPAVLEICRRLDCIPLAIELAAARTAGMTPVEIAALLDERFRLLTGGRRRAVERHHTLRAAVDWSYSLLGERERAVFVRLAVFAGSFDGVAAQAVAAADGIERFDVLDALDELVRKSMVTAEHTSDGTTRYSLLETLRQYALELLDAQGESDGCRRRHAEHYARFAEEVGPKLLGPEELLWRRRVRVDLDSLRGALGWAIERHDSADTELAFRILAGLARDVVLDRGAGLGAWAQRALESPHQGNPVSRAVVLTVAGYDRFHRGEFVDAEAAFQQAKAASAEAGSDTSLIIMGLANCAATGRGDITTAISLLDEAEARLGDAVGYDTAFVYAVSAIYRSVAGDYDRAASVAARAVQAARAAGQPSALALALYARAKAAEVTERKAAMRDCEESIRLVIDGACDIVYHVALGALAQLRWEGGDIDGALRSARDGLAYGYAIGDRSPLGQGLTVSAIGLAAVGNHEASARICGALLHGAFQANLRTVPSALRHGLDVALASSREAVGDDRFDASASRGAARSYDDAMQDILAVLGEVVSDIDST